MSAEQQLAQFIDKFAPDKRVLIRSCRAKMQQRFPAAVQLVYDNYNFLVIGFGPTTRASESLFSLAAYSKGVLLFFLQQGPRLPDPTGILRGTGKVVRNVILDTAQALDRPDVDALITSELALAAIPMGASDGHQVIVKSISAKQRPRR